MVIVLTIAAQLWRDLGSIEEQQATEYVRVALRAAIAFLHSEHAALQPMPFVQALRRAGLEPFVVDTPAGPMARFALRGSGEELTDEERDAMVVDRLAEALGSMGVLGDGDLFRQVDVLCGPGLVAYLQGERQAWSMSAKMAAQAVIRKASK
jgi:hypothetical protein